ncbi:MAG: hypothetical protein HUJ26_20985 [Planctomycetaceae bacterium]|nr:hypothetical protein [Planctomycetaceae bacterium]
MKFKTTIFILPLAIISFCVLPGCGGGDPGAGAPDTPLEEDEAAVDELSDEGMAAEREANAPGERVD